MTAHDFYSKAVLLDSLQLERTPDPRLADIVARALEDESNAARFFNDLENPVWLVPLRDRGVFRQPPSAQPDPSGGWRLPNWPAAVYLRRVMPLRPSEVIDIVSAWETNNARAYMEILEAAESIPVRFAARLVPLVIKWLDVPFDILLPEKASELMMYLSEHERWTSVRRLLTALIRPGEMHAGRGSLQHVRPQHDEYQTELVLNRNVPLLSGKNPGMVVDVLAATLRRAMRTRPDGRGGFDRYSYIWRPAIEEHEQNQSKDYRNALVTALRDALVTLIHTEFDIGRERVDKLISSSVPVIRRVALYVVSGNINELLSVAERVLASNVLDNDLECRHELYHLRRAAFPYLSLDTRSALVRRLTVGLSDDHDSEASRTRDVRVLRNLSAISEFLDGEYRQRYEELIELYGELEHPDFLVYSSGMQMGDRSPLTSSELGALDISGLIALFQSWKPPERFSLVSNLGLARTFQTLVSEQPQRFAPYSPRFAAPALRRYAQHLLMGLKDAHQAGRSFEWNAVFELCSELTNQSDEADTPADDEDFNHSWLLSAVSQLLEQAFQKDDAAPPEQLCPVARDLVIKLVRISEEPTEDYERTFGGSNMDPFTLSLNTARGRAMHALMSYCLFRGRTLDRSVESRGLQVTESRLEPLTMAVLDERLDTHVDPSLTVHSIYGFYFPHLLYLDHSWVLQNLARIFPSDDRLWNASFKSYVNYGQFRADIFELLRGQFERGISSLTPDAAAGRSDSQYPSQFAQHLAVAYWWGIEKLDSPLITDFFTLASDSARSSFVWLLWRALGESPPGKESPHWQRCIELWTWRAGEVSRQRESGQNEDELESYFLWLDVIPEDVSEVEPLIAASLPHLGRFSDTNRLIGYLDRQVEKYPRQAAELLEKVVELGKEMYLMSEHRNHVRHILVAALRSDDRAAQESADRIIGLYGRRADYSYEDLLK